MKETIIPQVLPDELKKIKSGFKFVLVAEHRGSDPANAIGYVRFGTVPQYMGIEGHMQIELRFYDEYNGAVGLLPKDCQWTSRMETRGGGLVNIECNTLCFNENSIDLGPYDQSFLIKTLEETIKEQCDYKVERPEPRRRWI